MEQTWNLPWLKLLILRFHNIIERIKWSVAQCFASVSFRMPRKFRNNSMEDFRFLQKFAPMKMSCYTVSFTKEEHMVICIIILLLCISLIQNSNDHTMQHRCYTHVKNEGGLYQSGMEMYCQ